MSAGERSCAAHGRCERLPSDWWDCNVYCPGYQSNGRDPDSGPKSQASLRFMERLRRENARQETDAMVRSIVGEIMDGLVQAVRKASR